MSESKKWKSKLLSSSFPLEYDVAKLLAKKGFSISADYTYSRIDSGTFKDFSVDIRACTFTPYRDKNNVNSMIEILVECKYRDENTKWIFLPDVNIKEHSNIEAGNTIRALYEFSPYSINSEYIIKFDKNIKHVYKGIEIKINNENVSAYDAEIKHGISQLQYALPRLLTENILFMTYNNEVKNDIFFICPILVTTADLMIMTDSINLNDIKAMDSIDNLGINVPYLLAYYDYGPDFEEHCKRCCEELKDLSGYNNIRNIIIKINENEKRKYSNPVKIGIALAEAYRFYLQKYFTHFIICNYNELPKLIDNLKTIIIKTIKTKERI